ncbi:alpha/beta hydrolase family protein [Actinoplanes sp. NPDC049265]|uniref:alpha/beta hydrolase family protein n=1 Tax=Actinoplanes sp. NPDC049265 TaxID=3363902 RepID=UPI003722BE20
MGRKVIAAALCAVLGLASCASPPPPPPPPASPSPSASPPVEPARFPVGSRQVAWSRGADRPLRTLLLFPAATTADNPGPAPAPAAVPIRRAAPPRTGSYPLVLFSHGLHGSPEGYSAAAASWAAAGFVVALPAYPYTNHSADPYRRRDMVNQPADAAYLLRKLIAVAADPGDPLYGHIDTTRVAAVGHSAGGFTTTGLFRAGHDRRLVAGVVIAGWMAPGKFGGAPARLLFVHADNDKVIPIADGRAAYAQAPWPKKFVVLPGATHAAFMHPGEPGYTAMDRTVTAFLRQTLGGHSAFTTNAASS